MHRLRVSDKYNVADGIVVYLINRTKMSFDGTKENILTMR